MRHRRIDPFFLIVADRDQGLFTVEGPMTDDTRWNKAVSRAQEAGRQVTCCNGGEDRARAVADYARTYGLRYAPPGTLIDISLM